MFGFDFVCDCVCSILGISKFGVYCCLGCFGTSGRGLRCLVLL